MTYIAFTRNLKVIYRVLVVLYKKHSEILLNKKLRITNILRQNIQNI